MRHRSMDRIDLIFSPHTDSLELAVDRFLKLGNFLKYVVE